MLLPNDHHFTGYSSRLLPVPDPLAVEERARELARSQGRAGVVTPEDRARAWAETLEAQWIEAADNIPMAQFFRTLCARAMRTMHRAEQSVDRERTAL